MKALLGEIGKKEREKSVRYENSEEILIKNNTRNVRNERERERKRGVEKTFRIRVYFP